MRCPIHFIPILIAAWILGGCDSQVVEPTPPEKPVLHQPPVCMHTSPLEPGKILRFSRLDSLFKAPNPTEVRTGTRAYRRLDDGSENRYQVLDSGMLSHLGETGDRLDTIAYLNVDTVEILPLTFDSLSQLQHALSTVKHPLFLNGCLEGATGGAEAGNGPLWYTSAGHTFMGDSLVINSFSGGKWASGDEHFVFDLSSGLRTESLVSRTFPFGRINSFSATYLTRMGE